MNEPAKAADAATSFPEGCAVFAKHHSAVKARIFSTSAKISDLSSADFYLSRVCFLISYTEVVCLLQKNIQTLCTNTKNTKHKKTALLLVKGYQWKAACICVCEHFSRRNCVLLQALTLCEYSKQKKYCDPFPYWWLNCSTGVFCESLFAQTAASSVLTSEPNAKKNWWVVFFFLPWIYFKGRNTLIMF